MSCCPVCGLALVDGECPDIALLVGVLKMSYAEGVQCCRFCQRLLTAEAIRDHICVEEIKRFVESEALLISLLHALNP